jgi:hypothetical protein
MEEEEDDDVLIELERGNDNWRENGNITNPYRWETSQTSSVINALPNFDIPPVKGWCFCPLSAKKEPTEWREKNKVMGNPEEGYLCNAKSFDNRKSFMDHLRSKSGNSGHRYVKEYLEKVWKA